MEKIFEAAQLMENAAGGLLRSPPAAALGIFAATGDDLDRQDMARLASGHDAGLNELMDRHAEKLFHYLCRIVHNETDATELAQESFVKAYQNRAKFDGARKFSTWLYTIATNLARDRLRWRDRRPEISLEAESPATGHGLHETLPEQCANPGEALVAEERAATVRRAVATLPEKWRVPLALAEYEEKSHAEIGEILNCSAKAVEVRIYKARQQLRQQLASLLVD